MQFCRRQHCRAKDFIIFFRFSEVAPTAAAAVAAVAKLQSCCAAISVAAAVAFCIIFHLAVAWACCVSAPASREA